MFRWLFVSLLLSASAVAAVWMLVPHVNSAPPSSPSEGSPNEESPTPPPERPSRQRSSHVARGTRGQPQVHVYARNDAYVLAEPVIIPDCPLDIAEKQEVASEKEGVLKFIGTDIQMGEKVAPENQLPEAHFGILAILVGDERAGNDSFQVPNDKRWFRRWSPADPLDPAKVFLFNERRQVRKLQVGDRVKRDQLLALVDSDKSFDEVWINIAKVDEVDSARWSAEQQRDEYRRRFREYRTTTPGAMNRDAIEDTRLKMIEAGSRETEKRKEMVGAQRKLNASITDLKKHQVRAAIDGIIKEIYKNHQGDAVKAGEAIMRIENPSRLRVKGRLEVQEALKLKKDMTAIIEATRPEAPRLVLSGHLDSVNCVAVSKGKRPVIVSGGDDEMLFGWDAVTGGILWTVWPLHSPVCAVACTPPGSKYNLACFGCFDGTVRLLDLDNPEREKLREMTERHNGPVFGVAFSPDGEVIATCGDDRLIRLWKTETGEMLSARTGHSGAVTSVQFTKTKRLVSAGKDNRLIVWDVEDVNRPHAISPKFVNRGGQVLSLGVSPDGKTVLFDQGKELRLLTLEDKQMVGSLQNISVERNFSTMALFSPDGKTILTNGSLPGNLQLWRTPVKPQMRGSELRQFIWKAMVTCGAFAPEDGSFAVTGTEDHKVLVWSMPSQKEIDSRLEAKLTLVEKYLDTQTRDVQVWAELDSPEWLIPGMRATMVVLPQK